MLMEKNEGTALEIDEVRKCNIEHELNKQWSKKIAPKQQGRNYSDR
jgi:hypothetical protein